MQNQKSSIVFDQDRASSYDQRFAKLAPLRDALHLLIRMVLAELPANARILCIGVGTGAELIYLAQAFPRWRFTAVDPAAPMLDICRQRAEEWDIASRCTFHEGILMRFPNRMLSMRPLVFWFLISFAAREAARFFSSNRCTPSPRGIFGECGFGFRCVPSAYQSLLEVWLRTTEVF